MNDDLETLFQRIQNEDDPFAKAKLLGDIKRNKQVTLRSVSARLQIKPSYISHILRLLKLPPLIIDGYYSHLVTLSHLFILSRLPDQKTMVELYEKVLSDSLTSLKVEELVREILYGVKSGGSKLEKKEVEDFLKKMNAEGKQVRIIQTRTKGKIILEIDGDVIKTTEELRKVMGVLTNFTYGDSEKQTSDNL